MRMTLAKVYNPISPDRGVLEIGKLKAIGFHLWKTRTGDHTDGYPGCKGVGAGVGWDSEKGLFALGRRSLPYAHDVLSATDMLEAWDTVLLAYASKGFTEDDAIHQARLARILWADDYNFKTQGIKLWNPTKLLW